MAKTVNARIMRSINKATVLRIIREKGPISKTKISSELETSMPTVIRMVDILTEQNLVRLSGETESSSGRLGGRRRQLLEFNGKAHLVIGIDMSNTEMIGYVADFNGEIILERRHEYNHKIEKNDIEPLWLLISQLVDFAENRPAELQGIVIGVPGFISEDHDYVKLAIRVNWENLPLKKLLSKRIKYPIYIENDINLITLGEWNDQNNRNISNLVSIFIGDGIGVGLIIGGNLYRGHNFAAGELGKTLPGISHLGKQYDQTGSLESIASDKGIVKRALRKLESDKAEGIPENLTIHDVFEASLEEKEWAVQVIDETIKHLSLSIINLSCILNPELIIIGGKISAYFDLITANFKNDFDKAAVIMPKLQKSENGRRASSLGAVSIVLDTLEQFSF